ncbi:MAG: ABC transporter permease [Clostridia bacterium]|nr:ABC transporter permease [Clostridia bacterium]
MNNKVNRKLLRLSGIFAIIFIVSMLIVGILEWIVLGISGTIDFIDAGDRWSASGERFAVITLYTEENSALSKDQVESWVHKTDTALLESSISPKENARSWAYTYAVEKTLTVSGPKAQATAEAIAAGGDFFVFHPQEFVYGSAFLNDPSNPNGVVIDEDLAWKIFGATDIVGMELTVNGTPFTVSGVSRPTSDTGIYAYTYGERPRMYMSYAGFIKLFGDDTHITMYEAALPNSVKGFARNIFNGAVSYNEETMSVMEASDRFSLLNRYNNMKILKYSWIRENKIEYPYWENEAKVSDYRCAILMIFEAAFAAAAVISMLLAFILLRISGYTVTDSMKNSYHMIQESRAGSHKKPPEKKKIRRKRGV